MIWVTLGLIVVELFLAVEVAILIWAMFYVDRIEIRRVKDEEPCERAEEERVS